MEAIMKWQGSAGKHPALSSRRYIYYSVSYVSECNAAWGDVGVRVC